MKIYTKTGDTGETTLLGGTRLPKYDLRIEAYGTVDELNAYLGHLADQEVCQTYRPFLQELQQDLFTIGSNLATEPGNTKVKLPALRKNAVLEMEQSIDTFEEELPPLKNFVLPGGHPTNSLAHICRCVCRRTERRIIELHKEQPIAPEYIAYFNRLSDWLFVFSRWISHHTQSPEVPWKPQR